MKHKRPLLFLLLTFFTISGGQVSHAQTLPATNWVWQSVSNWTGPGRRLGACTTWTGQELIVWGGWDEAAQAKVNTGVRYNPTTGTVQPMTTLNAPAARYRATIVWTGTEAIVWGGEDPGDHYLNDGARYNPSTDQWTPMNPTGAPAARFMHTAIWTGSDMIIWGGGIKYEDDRFGRDYRYDEFNDGALYDPATDRWRPMNLEQTAYPRRGHTATWTGTHMIVCGGHRVLRDVFGDDQSATDAYFMPKEIGMYHPATDTWSTSEPDKQFAARTQHTAVWTGRELILWGGFFVDSSGDGDYSPDVTYLNTGARFNPATGLWRPTTEFGSPAGRFDHVACWNGREMLICGHEEPSEGGGHYDPVTDTWRYFTPPGAPGVATSGAWTGSQWLVHGRSIHRYALVGPYLNDAIPDEWQLAYFGENAEAGNAASDPDQDGAPNASEYLAGTDPTQATSQLRFEVQPLDPAVRPTTLAITCSPRLDSRRYEILSYQSVTGTPSPVTDITIKDNDTVRSYLIPILPHRPQEFFLLRVSIQ